MSAVDDTDALFGAIQAGAQGYVLKDSEPGDLLRAIRVVASGGAYLDPSVTPQLLEGIRRMGYSRQGIEQRRLHLTDREVQVLAQLAAPHGPQQIGRSMGISTKTVQNHISSIYRKLGVNSRSEAVVRASTSPA